MYRRGVHPILMVTAWWKKKTGGKSNQADQQRVESGYQGNPMSITTVAASDGIGAVTNNLYMKGNQGFVNKPSVDAAEAPVSFAALKGKEAQLHDEPLHYEAPVSLAALKEKEVQLSEEPLHYENSVAFAPLKEKEAQLNDEPSALDSHYEQVQDQKAK